MKPFAAKTVGDPKDAAPRRLSAFEGFFVYSSLVMCWSSDHRNTSLCVEGAKPPFVEVRRLDIEDEREMDEKPDGEGEAPSKR